jgi:tripartite-type tricarboxylate transporter receptor subunit TctC
LFKTSTGIEIAHVPYRGQGPALNDLIGGQIQVMFPIVPDVIGHIRSAACAHSPCFRASEVPRGC